MGGNNIPLDIKIQLPFVNDPTLIKPLCPEVDNMINHGWPLIFADSAITTEKLSSSSSTIIQKHRGFIKSYLKKWIEELESLKKQLRELKSEKSKEDKVATQTKEQDDCNSKNSSMPGLEGDDENLLRNQEIAMGIMVRLPIQRLSSSTNYFNDDFQFDTSSESSSEEDYFNDFDESDDEEITSLSLIFELDFIQNFKRLTPTTPDQIKENKQIALFNQDKLVKMKNILDMEYIGSFRGLKYEIKKNLTIIERLIVSDAVKESLPLLALFVLCKADNVKLLDTVNKELLVIDGFYADIILFGKFF